MKKAANILLLIGGILAIFCAVAFLIMGVVFIIASGPALTEPLIEGIESGAITTNFQGATTEEIVKIVQSFFLLLGIMFICFVPFTIADCVICFVGKSKQTKGMYILNIVFGVLGSTIINTVGGVLGLIATIKEGNRAAENG